ncbi:MAG: Peptidase family S41 [Candidatus Methanolliviera sp. GoM_oil]|nr:MAG: Peptidase family S41 [Candidatus Methanolliviera sp. GoM_oil]
MVEARGPYEISHLYTPIPYEFRIINEKTVLMTFNSFREPKTFKTFLKGMFFEIKENNIKNLIIDLRYNGGGDASIGNMLLEYLTDEPFRQFSRYDIKISKQYIEQIGSWLDWLGGGGTGDITSHEVDFIKPTENPLRFNGNIYVLTSGRTYSSASAFAVTIKDFSIGKIIGEETGWPPTAYGDHILFTLPNSKINAECSCKYFIRPSGEDTYRGVIPDYIVEPQPEDLITGKDRVMEFTLKLIEEKK